MGELIAVAWRGIRRRKARSRLTWIGIAVGVLLVSLVAVIGQVGRQTVERELTGLGLDGLAVSSTGTAVLDREALRDLRALPGVAAAAPLLLNTGTVTATGGESRSLLCGMDAGADPVISLQVLYGRALTAGEIAAAARVCLLDERLSTELFHRRNAVGRTLTADFGGVEEQLTVVGITAAESTVLQSVSSLIPGMVCLPYTTQAELTGQSGFDEIAVRSADGDLETTKHAVNAALTRLYGSDEEFSTENLATQRLRLNRLVTVVTVILTVISGISLPVAGFGILTAMLAAVGERTREIGIRKAVGASERRILGEFLTEAVLLSGIGGVIGLLPATVLSAVLSVRGVCTHPPLLLLLGIGAVSLLLGVLFGGYPAWKAARLEPADALRRDL